MKPRELVAAVTRIVNTLELLIHLSLISLLCALLGAVFIPLVEGRFFLDWFLWFVLLSGMNGGLVKISRAGRSKLGEAGTTGQWVWDAFSVVGGAFLVCLFGGVLQDEWHKGMEAQSLAIFAVPTLAGLVSCTTGLVRYGRYVRALWGDTKI